MNFKININERVKVKLTSVGKDILYDRHEELNKMIRANGSKGLGEFELKTDDEGYTSFSIWELMNTFGSHMHMGLPVPFETEVIMTNGTPINSWLMNK
jgi:hypothetical protein